MKEIFVFQTRNDAKHSASVEAFIENFNFHRKFQFSIIRFIKKIREFRYS